MKDIAYFKQFEPIDGKWIITKRIGEGSFGQVFEIERIDAEEGHRYKAALKAISIPTSESELAERRAEFMDEKTVSNYYRRYIDYMKNELHIMNSLKGQTNIVSYEDHLIHEHEDGIGADILIRMELLKPLNAYIAENGFTERDVIRLGIDMCTALEVCGKKKLIHRDIKPGNIFISDTDDFKLGDFGIARIADNAFANYTTAIGTESYMSPEVYLRKPYGPSVDIYSLGMVLYHLTNRNRGPFLSPGYKSSDRIMALDRRMRGEELPQPENCSPALWQVLHKACAFDPDMRYSTPTEMKQDLQAILPMAQQFLVLQPYAGKQEQSETVLIRFWDGNKLLSSRNYVKGACIELPTAPVRPATADRYYRFTGWEPAIKQTATQNADYYASFWEEVIQPAPPPEPMEYDATSILAEDDGTTILTEDEATTILMEPPAPPKRVPWKAIAIAAAIVIAIGIMIPVSLSLSPKADNKNEPSVSARAESEPSKQEAQEEAPAVPSSSVKEEEPAAEPEDLDAEPAEEEEAAESTLPVTLEWEDNWADHLPEDVNGENSALEVRLVYHSAPIVQFVNTPNPGEQYVPLPEYTRTELPAFSGPYYETTTPVYKDNYTDVYTTTETFYNETTVTVPTGPDQWTDWISAPLAGFEYSQKEESVFGTSARYYGHFTTTETKYEPYTVTTYHYRKRVAVTYYFFYDKSSYTDFSTTPILPSADQFVTTKMQYRYVPVEDGVFALPSMDNFETFDDDYTGRFPDVDPSKWYAPEKTDILRTACEYSFLLPDMYTYFHPEDTVTLGQAIRAAVMIYRVYNGSSALLEENTGKYDRYIAYAVDHGLMLDGELTELDRPATRQELAYLFSNALPAEELPELISVDRVVDMDMSYKYYDCALTLAKAGVIRLGANDSFRPDDTATRAELASIIDHMIYPAHRFTE